MSKAEFESEPRNQTERAVWDAAEQIQREGREATYEAVRELLGRGSNTTIGKYLNTYFARHRSMARLPALEAEREDRVAKLGAQLVNELVLQSRKELQEAIAEINARAAEEIATAQRAREESERQVAVARDSYAALTRQCEDLQKHRETESQKVVSLETRLYESDSKIRDLQKQLDATQTRLDDAVRKQGELQTAAASDLKALRDKHDEQVGLMRVRHEHEINTLRQAASKQQIALNNVRVELERAQERLEQATARGSALNEELNRSRAHAEQTASQLREALSAQSAAKEREKVNAEALARVTLERDREREAGDRAREAAAARFGQIETLEGTIRRLEERLKPTPSPDSPSKPDKSSPD